MLGLKGGGNFFVFFAAFLQVLFILRVCEANFSNYHPFYLISVFPLSGTSTKSTPCIGQLISQQHLLTPARCLYFKNLSSTRPWAAAKGVFIDYRVNGTKKYSTNKSKFPLNDMFYSSSINIHPDFNVQNMDNDIAVITLAKAFNKNNKFNITATPIQRDFDSMNKQHFFFYQRQLNETILFKSLVSIKNNIASPDSIPLQTPGMVYHRNVDFSYNLLGFVTALDSDGRGNYIGLKTFCDWIESVTKTPCLPP